MFLEKLRSLSLPRNSKSPEPHDMKNHPRRSSMFISHSDGKNPLSPSTTNSTTKSHSPSHRLSPKTSPQTEAMEVSKENAGNENVQEGNDDEESNDFREYLEKCRKAEEDREKRRKKILEAEKRRRATNLSPWAGRM